MSTTAAPHTVIHWYFTAPDGSPADRPWGREGPEACLDIHAELGREYALADADPDFAATSFAFCRVRTFLAYTLTLRRGAFDGEAGEWLGYRQPDGSYRREEAP